MKLPLKENINALAADNGRALNFLCVNKTKTRKRNRCVSGILFSGTRTGARTLDLCHVRAAL